MPTDIDQTYQESRVVAVTSEITEHSEDNQRS